METTKTTNHQSNRKHCNSPSFFAFFKHAKPALRQRLTCWLQWYSAHAWWFRIYKVSFLLSCSRDLQLEYDHTRYCAWKIKIIAQLLVGVIRQMYHRCIEFCQYFHLYFFGLQLRNLLYHSSTNRKTRMKYEIWSSFETVDRLANEIASMATARFQLSKIKCTKIRTSWHSWRAFVELLYIFSSHRKKNPFDKLLHSISLTRHNCWWFVIEQSLTKFANAN